MPHVAQHFAASADPSEVTAYLSRHGYAIVDRLATTDQLDRLDAEVGPYLQRSAAGRDAYDGLHTRRTGSLISRCPTSREFVMNPLVVKVVKGFLAHATAVQLHLTQIISIEPGETRQKPHRDQMAFDFYPFPATYHVQCNTMWALSDFTMENGATHIHPGSSEVSDHDGLNLPSIQAEMTRGSALFYDGKVMHGGGANRSTGVRRGVNITYSVGWVRQEENQYLACPPEVAATLDDELLMMMGYQQGAFALGYVGDQEDPLSVLRGTHNKARVVSDFSESNESFRNFVAELPPS